MAGLGPLVPLVPLGPLGPLAGLVLRELLGLLGLLGLMGLLVQVVGRMKICGGHGGKRVLRVMYEVTRGNLVRLGVTLVRLGQDIVDLLGLRILVLV